MAEPFIQEQIPEEEQKILSEQEVRSIIDDYLLNGNYLIRTRDGSVVSLSELLAQTQKAFGGDGSDGDLIISSGTTTLDLSGARYFAKNYKTFSITGTGKLAFSNPHADGTIITIKAQDNVTITSSGTPTIDLTSIGGTGGTEGGDANPGNPGNIGTSVFFATGSGKGGIVANTNAKIAGATGGESNIAFISIDGKTIPISCGAGGGGGSRGANTGTGGAGGRGGGALLIECREALDFGASSDINLDGTDGGNGNDTYSAGGGGGGGGVLLILYNTLTTNAGTVTATGGDGGAGNLGVFVGGAGGTGQSIGGAIPNGGAGGGSNFASVDTGLGGSGGAGGGGGNAGSDGTDSTSTSGAGGGGGGGGAWAIIENITIV